MWEALHDALRVQVRRAQHHEPTASAVRIDSQSTTVTAIPGARGYDAGTKVPGRKKTIVVDTLGVLLRVAVHPAASSDLVAGKVVTERVGMMRERIKKVLGDQHDGGQDAAWVKERVGWETEVTQRPAHAEGFVVIAKRWIVERTCG